jgi:Flp pilus assembly protein TadG
MIGGRIRGVSGDSRGAALVEFALVLPFLVLLFVGTYQFNDAISVNRKVTRATRTVADLTSQFTSVNTADLATILNATTQILAPYSTAGARMTVSQIKIDANGVATVDWSAGKNTSGLVKGTAFTLPVRIRQPNTWLIVASTDYAYVPAIAPQMIGSIPLSERIIMSPRASASVEKRP